MSGETNVLNVNTPIQIYVAALIVDWVGIESLIGSVSFMVMAHSQPHLALVKLTDKYGGIMRVKLGLR